MPEPVTCPHCDAATRAHPDTLYMEAGVNTAYEGFVHLAWRKERMQFTPADARQHALALLEIATAAEYEAAFMRWCRDKLDTDMEQAALLLMELRDYFTLAEERPSGGRTF